MTHLIACPETSGIVSYLHINNQTIPGRARIKMQKKGGVNLPPYMSGFYPGHFKGGVITAAAAKYQYRLLRNKIGINFSCEPGFLS
jgi:hypothetical protein